MAALLLATATLVVAGCATDPAERSAEDLAVQVLGEGVTTLDLGHRREVSGGFAWRRVLRLLSPHASLPRATHVGVIACADGDGDGDATEAVRFSHLHWEPERCVGGRAQLRRVDRSPEQDARELDSFIGPPRPIDNDPALKRIGR